VGQSTKEEARGVCDYDLCEADDHKRED